MVTDEILLFIPEQKIKTTKTLIGFFIKNYSIFFEPQKAYTVFGHVVLDYKNKTKVTLLNSFFLFYMTDKTNYLKSTNTLSICRYHFKIKCKHYFIQFIKLELKKNKTKTVY